MLSSAPVAIEAYERARKRLGRRRLIAEIERLSVPRVLPGEEKAADVLRIGWSVLVASLKEAYEVVERDNPLSRLVIERIVDSSEAFVVALGDEAAREALYYELVVGYGWSSDKVIIQTLPELSRSRALSDRVIAVGIDGSRRSDIALWSLLPKNVEVFAYPHMIGRLQKWTTAISLALTQQLAAETAETARQAFGAAAQSARNAAGAFEITLPSLNLAGLRSSVRRESNRKWAMTESEQLQPGVEDELLYEDPDDNPDDPGATFTNVPQARVFFSDGATRVFARTTEVLVLEGDDVEARPVSALERGDHVLYLVDAEYRSLFRAIRERTSYLADVDDRVIERWDSALSRIRSQYDPADGKARSKFVRDILEKGCKKDGSTILGWLDGKVKAPRDLEDIIYVMSASMSASGFAGDVGELGRHVHREITTFRTFSRHLGRRIRTRMNEPSSQAKDALTAMIDEFLEGTEERVVERVELLD